MAGTKIAVIGAGSWGSALAVLLARKGLDVMLWGRDAAAMAAMRAAPASAWWSMRAWG